MTDEQWIKHSQLRALQYQCDAEAADLMAASAGYSAQAHELAGSPKFSALERNRIIFYEDMARHYRKMADDVGKPYQATLPTLASFKGCMKEKLIRDDMDGDWPESDESKGGAA